MSALKLSHREGTAGGDCCGNTVKGLCALKAATRNPPRVNRMDRDAEPAKTPEAPDEPRAEQPVRPWPDDALAIVPMRNLVLFPQALTPVSIGRTASLLAVQQALHEAGRNQEPHGLQDRPATETTRATAYRAPPLGFMLQKDAQADAPGPGDLCEVGTRVQVMRVQMEGVSTAPHSTATEPSVEAPAPPSQHLVCLGVSRFRVREWLFTEPFLLARVDLLEDEPVGTSAEAAAHRLRERASELLGLLPGAPAELMNAVQSTRDPAVLGHAVAALLDAEVAEKQSWLEMTDTAARLERILRRLEHRLEVLRLSQEIGLRTREQLEDRERRALLREQMQAIRRELGEDESASEQTQALRQRLDAAGLPAAVKPEVEAELKRLSQLPPVSSEHALLLGWLQWVSELPWALPTRQVQPVSLSLAQARRVLDADHFGLEKIKRDLLEHLAVRQLQLQSGQQGHAPILCLVGPPGVGKTSIGQSVARALDRPFGRLALGGVHDESEIRGHRRTYVGALPGLVLQTLRRCGARDAVVMLDEIDKLSPSAHGDPTAALLEVLDPAQNHTFRDHYLGLPFDLSAVMFLATANVLEAIPLPLRDRMEVIELHGYTAQEKLEIARAHLLPRQRQASGLPLEVAEDRLGISDEVLAHVIEHYTREAGVRQLERRLAALMRRAAWSWAQDARAPAELTIDDLPSVLGPAPFRREVAMRLSIPGVVTGLAWTPTGGDILFVEASRVPGTNRVQLTGQLGEVMRESAQAALTLLKSRASTLGLSPSAFDAVDVHVHVPAGAVPKDGPSAGVAIFLALASVFTGRAVAHDLAITGEISLRGLVLPVGGIRDKVLAASRAGIRRLLLPTGNQPDWAEVPTAVQAGLSVRWVESVDEALDEAWSPAKGADGAVAGATSRPAPRVNP